MPPVHEVRLKVGPYSDDQIAVNFEPIGMSYELLPGDYFDVVIRGPGSGLVEIGYAPRTVVIGAWGDAETLVWTSDGRRLPA